jgi:hypothetical protein
MTQRACSQGKKARAATAANLGHPLSNLATMTLLSLVRAAFCSSTGNTSAYSSPADLSVKAAAQGQCKGDAKMMVWKSKNPQKQEKTENNEPNLL